MEYDMKKWVAQTIASPRKPASPILAFPAVKLLGLTVRELISSSEHQAAGMKKIAEKVSAGMAVSLMDLSVEAECFGAQVRMSDEEVPTVVGSVVNSEDDAEKLEIPAVGAGRTGIYIEAVSRAVQLIGDRPVLAGAIGPFSLAGRLMDVSQAMICCYEEPDMVHTVLKKATAFLIELSKAYKRAGANGILMAEPLAGTLSPALAEEFAHPYAKQMVDAVQDDTFAVIYHNCGSNVARMRDGIYRIGAMGYHFGNACCLADMFEGAPEDVLIMGNVDPAVQLCGGTPASVRAATLTVMEQCARHPNFVISSGCDIPPSSPWENVLAFFSAAEEFYQSR